VDAFEETDILEVLSVVITVTDVDVAVVVVVVVVVVVWVWVFDGYHRKKRLGFLGYLVVEVVGTDNNFGESGDVVVIAEVVKVEVEVEVEADVDVARFGVVIVVVVDVAGEY
jgi:ABC-type sugar transport system permease subunit